MLIPEENACFPHPRVPDKEEFEEKIVGLLGHGSTEVVSSLFTVHWLLVNVTVSVSPGEAVSHISSSLNVVFCTLLGHFSTLLPVGLSRLGCALCSETKIRF